MGSYTPPARDAIELQYVGNYTPPARDAIELQYDPGAQPPVVLTFAATDITPTSAVGHGRIADDGSSPITQHGVCWKKGGDPVDLAGADGYTQEGVGNEGDFTSTLSPLTGGSRYYYRAYATNSLGTGYGDAVDFLTSLVLSESLAVSANVGKGAATSLPEMLSLADSTAFQKTFIKSLLESVGVSDGEAQRILLALQENAVLWDSVHASLRKLLGDAVALDSAISLHPAKRLIESLSLSSQIAITLHLIRSLEEVASLEDIERASFLKPLTETLPLGDAVVKAAVRTLSDTLLLDDSFEWRIAFVRHLADSLGVSDDDTQRVVLKLRETIGLGLLIQAINLLDTGLKLDAGWILDSYYISSERIHIALTRAIQEILDLSAKATRGRGLHLSDDVNIADEIAKGIERAIKDIVVLSSEASSRSDIAKILREVLLSQDRLRIGDIWDDPTTRIWVTILNAALRVEVE